MFSVGNLVQCRTVWAGLFGMALLVTGCGTIQHENVSNTGAGRRHYKIRAGRPVRVAVGTVSANAKLHAELREAVARYLIDQGKALCGQHDLFEIVDTRRGSASLLDQFMETDGAPAKTAEVDATLEITVTSLKETKGATVKVGLVSRQSKKAIAEVEARLRLANGKVLTARAKGVNTKGAVGAIAMVNRRAMDKQDGVWALDGSMAGGACTKALAVCVEDLARLVHRDLRRLSPDAAERFLRPASIHSRR
jgi:hypothetical protein